MIIVTCNETLDRVGVGFTCVVGVRTLKHLTSTGQVSALQLLGAPRKTLNRVAFVDMLRALSIPTTAVAPGSNYSGR
ncbi:hypothetical protein EDF38_0906 [Frigoribacterium sp. PhB160]|jgi:hypothetical protein|uniref:hypothetical protein n=1 Tax=Frigoribacterium sp. PhB160 TaxID=2485192 RepID=UPI000F4A961D|nr:hypothetical protein [Frigoribacterium sp. PhB160]ROS61808.1 hypothetical protein EDF38_0906 [Frigoribacterium sp. PhB160]